MKKNTMVLTRKIQINIDLSTAEQQNEVRHKLYKWQNICFRAANLIMTHLYMQVMIKDFFYLSEDIKYKMVDEKTDVEGMLQSSHSNCTYRMLSNRYKGDIPTNILNHLNYELMNKFKKNYIHYVNGTRSLDNFKSNLGFPFGSEAVRHLYYNKERKMYCFSLFRIPFRAYLGNDFTDKHKLLQRVIAGEIKLCSSQIKLDKGKIFWLAVFEIPKEKHSLKPEVVAEASLSLEYPISVKIGNNSVQIGNKEEFLYRRLAIQAAHARTKVGATYCRGGNGKERKLKLLKRYNDLESNYVTNRLHEYSRRLIDFCVKHQAATLILQDIQRNAEIAKEERFVLRNWNYYELMTKIKYKANKVGIELIIT